MDYVSTTRDVSDRATARSGPVMTARLLGRFTIAIDGEVVDTQSSRRTRNILAYLLTNRCTPVPRDVLMEVFWPNVDEGAARNSLHVTLTGVRNALSACTVGTDPAAHVRRLRHLRLGRRVGRRRRVRESLPRGFAG
jgi:DNA-binding SARP family transcriptional activator